MYKKTTLIALVTMFAYMTASAEMISLADASLEAAFMGTQGTPGSGWFSFGYTGSARTVVPGSFWGGAAGITGADGPRAAFAYQISENDGGAIYQAIQLDAGVTYKLSASVGMSVSAPKNDGKYAIVFFDSGLTTELAATTGTVTTRGSFSDASVVFTADTTGVYHVGVRNRGYVPDTGGANDSTVFFDNVRLEVIDNLYTTPSETFSSFGNEGGPFMPSNMAYILRNLSTSDTIDWVANGSESWVSASPASGTLAPLATVDVTVSINSTATSLLDGIHTASMVFSNQLSGIIQTRIISLVVLPPVGPIHVAPSGNDSNDGRTWGTAKATIQAGVDAQQYEHGYVFVSNGTYSVSSEITVDKNITIQSVNGSDVTIVDGKGTVRCFNLGSSACTISGFTIQNGSASHGGGIYCQNTTPVVDNCTISGNSAGYGGGGMFVGTANNCTISGNSASSIGGGMVSGTANNCTITGNSASGGGGMYDGTATHCTISGNVADWGGGLSSGTANNCTITGNSASIHGGGMYRGTANNCTIRGNSAKYGGGMSEGTANNCTISGNSASQVGGGMYPGTANNCIVWYNEAPTGKNLLSTTVRFTCSPDGAHGVDGNITNAPMLLSASHIATNSPCRGAGSSEYATGTDIDGSLWQDPPSMGCDEPITATGSLNVAIECSATEVLFSTPISFTGQIEGALFKLVWDFGDGTSATNTPWVTHSWGSAGTYAVVLTAYNDTWPDGVSATQAIVGLTWDDISIHVSPTGDDANDGSSWNSAKATIQAGIDAQQYAGGWVWVSNGTYAVTNEILVNKEVVVKSVNGPEATIVDGQGSVRCFNLGNSACVIEGLTITNGYTTGDGGGIYCSGITPIITNCTITGNSASSRGGGMYDGTANNCTISGNSAKYGGGMCRGTANNCTISGNSASSLGGGLSSGTANHCSITGNSASGHGGGMYDGTATHCTISGNSASSFGGGMYDGTANNCTNSGNVADWGGGMFDGTANKCTISGNSASDYGGGMYHGTANNCTISGNSASSHGGGMYDGTANNCTISGNSAKYGGGMYRGTANNCTITVNSATYNGGGLSYGTALNSIIWHNQSDRGGADLHFVAATNSCSSDVPHGVAGNITTAPLLASASHIASDSPCIGSGSTLYSSGTDIDGQAWLNPPSMGCDEYHGAGSVTGTLSVAIDSRTNVVVGYALNLVAEIQGAVYRHVWDFSDGTAEANNIGPSHSWSVSGTYDVVLTAFNDTYPSGISATQTIQVLSLEHQAVYVASDGDDSNDGSSWATAKATIQAGVDAQQYEHRLVLVSNGTYSVTSEISVGKNIMVQSVNGPGVTIVDGGGTSRCFNLGSTCVLSGFTATNGYSSSDGGGIYCAGATALIHDCVIEGNHSDSSGGGVIRGMLSNCVIRANTVDLWGGGCHYSDAFNCIISGNTAVDGGGAGGNDNVIQNCLIFDNEALVRGGGVLNVMPINCTITGNRALVGGGICSTWSVGRKFYNCIISGNHADVFSPNIGVGRGTFGGWQGWNSCSPELEHGINGNITNAPMLVSLSCLSSNSPCIGAGSITNVFGTDLYGELWQDPPSMGCDEFHGTASITGTLEVAVVGESEIIAGHPSIFCADIRGAVHKVVWDFDDGTSVTNSPVQTRQWNVPGDYPIILTAFNNSNPAGVAVSKTIHVIDPADVLIYVAVAGDDANDGASWESAKATIQAGVDAQQYDYGRIWVSNGTYAVTNQIIARRNGLMLESVGGADKTIIDGSSSTRCLNIAGQGLVKGFTIQNGSVPYGHGGGLLSYCPEMIVEGCVVHGNIANSGGGVFKATLVGCVVSNNVAAKNGGGMDDGSAYDCVVVGNTAKSGGGLNIYYDNQAIICGKAVKCIVRGNTATDSGGGIAGGTNYNCLVEGNFAANSGGGIFDGQAINCTVAGNVAGASGGGVFKSAIMDLADINSIVHGNTAPLYPNFQTIAIATNCCAPDMEGAVSGWVVDDPQFVDAVNGDYRLQAESPCINWGNTADVEVTVDLDGNPRVVEGYVDMGCYEYQSLIGEADNDGDGMSDAWERQWFGSNVLPEDNLDGDGSLNEDEYIAGTDPTNGTSFFHATTDASEAGFVIEWVAVTGRVYNVYWTPSLTQEFQPLEIGIPYPQHSYTDTVHSAESSGYYRVVVMRADYDADGDGLPNDWESQFVVSDAFADGDDDGFNNMAEFISGTNPTNGTSFFSVAQSLAEVNGTNCFVVEWISIPDRLYSVQWSTNLVSGFQTLETGIEHPQNSYTDTTHTAESEGFFQVDVRMK